MTSARSGRRRRRVLATAVVATIAMTSIAGVTGGTRRAVAVGFAGPGFIGAPGGPFMTDGYGRKLQLHGVNLVAKCPSFSTVAATDPGKPCIPGPDVVEPPGVPSYWLSPNPANLAVDPETTFTDADAARLADLGFNIVRLGIIWRALEPGKMANPAANDLDFCTPRSLGTRPLKPADDQLDVAGRVDPYLAHVDDTVNLLAAHGILTLLDMHQDNWNEHFNNPGSATPWEGEGAPLWATCTNVTGTTNFLPSSASTSNGWSEDNIHDPALSFTQDHFWSNDVSGNLQAQYIRVWQEVARHYRDNQWVVGYDPFNEPIDSFNTLSPTAVDSRLQCFYLGSQDPVNSRCNLTVPASEAPAVGFIPAILDPAVDPNHLVFYEGPVVTDYHGIETVGIGFPMNYGHLVLSFHVYPPVGAFGGGECSSAACAPNDELTVRNALQARGLTSTAQPGGPAIFASEFGAEDYLPDLAHDADLFDGSVLGTLPIGWAYWSAFQNHDPTGQPNERLFTSDRGLQPKGATLGRAYPRATAGNPTPGAQRYSPDSAAFDYAYAPDHAINAPTEIVVPPARYGQGYKVTVSGAGVTSACGVNPVTLAADPGATSVTFHVEPAAACSPDFVTLTCNPANPPGPNNPCPAGPGGLPTTAAGQDRGPVFPAAGILVALGFGVGAAALNRGRRRRRSRPRHH